MILAAHQPGPPLDHFIDTMWFFDGYDPDHSMERLLPDATTEIVINLQPEPRGLFQRDDFVDRWPGMTQSEVWTHSQLSSAHLEVLKGWLEKSGLPGRGQN